jgi:tetratricopeptide (TPR) repeat protein
MVCLTGVCYQSLGQFRSAVSQFSRALLLDQTSCCWYQREVALFIWSRLDKSLKTFNLDSEVDPRIKDGWCKRASWRHILPSASSNSSFLPNERYVPLTQPKQVSDFDENTPNPPDQHTNSTPPHCEKPQLLPSQSPTLFLPRPPSSKQEAIEKLLHFTAPYGEWLQLRCPGFLPNIRQVTAAHNALLLLLSRRTFSPPISILSVSPSSLHTSPTLPYSYSIPTFTYSITLTLSLSLPHTFLSACYVRPRLPSNGPKSTYAHKLRTSRRSWTAGSRCLFLIPRSKCLERYHGLQE